MSRRAAVTALLFVVVNWSFRAYAEGGTQTIVPFVDGMTIRTSNSVANVEIRAQSQGPGACAVEFSSGNKKIGLLAPPFAYTPWTVLISNIGAVTLVLNDDVKCDTGVLAQVRYYK